MTPYLPPTTLVIKPFAGYDKPNSATIYLAIYPPFAAEGFRFSTAHMILHYPATQCQELRNPPAVL